jgi:hypothetical protein
MEATLLEIALLENSLYHLILIVAPANGPALSCGVDNIRNAPNETSSRFQLNYYAQKLYSPC